MITKVRPPRQKHIAIYTSTRAEYGIWRPLLFAIEEDPTLKLTLLISGTHLSSKHGHTIDQIQSDGFSHLIKIPMDLDHDNPTHLAQSLGQSIGDWSQHFDSSSYDLLMILGDRYEILGPVQAAMIHHLPVAHVHGGEVTEGAMDDAIRHAVTKLSHLHFPAAEAYQKRILQLGESIDRVFNVGALGLEGIDQVGACSFDELRNMVQWPELHQQFLLVTYHPVTLQPEASQAETISLLNALDRFPHHSIMFTGVNADPGSGWINQKLHEVAEQQPQRIKCFASLGQKRYIHAMQHASVVVGNSSSGIIEAPYVGTATVNIGDRQKGRLMANSVISCHGNEEDIFMAITKSLSLNLSSNEAKQQSLYGQGETSRKIIDIIKKTPLNRLTQKSFVDLLS
jgi:UDP-hydrolysing UDP-N-acetyl-D-glucosamine 2-epimerase